MTDDADNLVSLAAVRSEARAADVRLVLSLWRLEDGTVRYHAEVEERVPDGSRGLSDGWLRDNLRWAILCYARAWRMGLWWRSRGRWRR